MLTFQVFVDAVDTGNFQLSTHQILDISLVLRYKKSLVNQNVDKIEYAKLIALPDPSVCQQ